MFGQPPKNAPITTMCITYSWSLHTNKVFSVVNYYILRTKLIPYLISWSRPLFYVQTDLNSLYIIQVICITSGYIGKFLNIKTETCGFEITTSSILLIRNLALEVKSHPEFEFNKFHLKIERAKKIVSILSLRTNLQIISYSCIVNLSIIC